MKVKRRQFWNKQLWPLQILKIAAISFVRFCGAVLMDRTFSFRKRHICSEVIQLEMAWLFPSRLRALMSIICSFSLEIPHFLILILLEILSQFLLTTLFLPYPSKENVELK